MPSIVRFSSRHYGEYSPCGRVHVRRQYGALAITCPPCPSSSRSMVTGQRDRNRVPAPRRSRCRSRGAPLTGDRPWPAFPLRVRNLSRRSGVLEAVTAVAPRAALHRLRACLGGAAVVTAAVAFGGAVAAADVVRPHTRFSVCRLHGDVCALQALHGVQSGLARLPWIAASPTSTGLVGHLFYYDGLNVWRQRQLPGVRIYSGGQSPDGRVSMKILWSCATAAR